MVGVLKLLMWVLLFAVAFWIADQILDIVWKEPDEHEEDKK